MVEEFDFVKKKQEKDNEFARLDNIEKYLYLRAQLRELLEQQRRDKDFGHEEGREGVAKTIEYLQADIAKLEEKIGPEALKGLKG